jgi:hypothetical protein
MKESQFMTTKISGKASPSKKEALKKTPKGEPAKAEPSKQEKKSAKAADLEPELNETDTPTVDADEIEEEEEAAAASGNAGGNAAALAAAAGTATEMSASFKNFRHHPDMENFYRFIFENDLRHEALAIIDEIIVDKQHRRNKR